jgi:hypothetical protein
MTEEPKKAGRPRKQVLIGAEKTNEDWEHPPLQGHTEEPSASLPENPTDASPAVDSSVKEAEIQEKASASTVYTPNPVAVECPPGYQTMDSAPTNCKIVVSETGEDQTCVYWRERRVVDRKNLRYLKEGAWTNDFTRLDIDFEPKFWRPYVSSDYFPAARVK